MNIIALLGPSASGKTSIALEIAHKIDAYILSLDSLSVYKEIDIASAKPTKQERGDTPYFGLDIITPDTNFSINLFCDEYKKAYKKAEEDNKNLVIVGGTSFYLKSLIDGLSIKPQISQNSKIQVSKNIQDLDHAYEKIKTQDPSYNIAKNDKYRMEKWFEIFYETGKTTTEYFKENPRIPIIEEKIKILNIDISRNSLKPRIHKRTRKMIDMGLVEEVTSLKNKYDDNLNIFKAIGIKETLEYINNQISLEELTQKITQNTLHLAKRQQTFNRTQFKDIIQAPLNEILSKV